MSRFKLPRWGKAYVYLSLIAVGLVLLFTWGQLTFFSIRELTAPEQKEYTTGQGSYLRERRPGSPGSYFSLASTEKPKGFFSSVRAAFRTYEKRRYIEKLKNMEKDVEDSEDKAQLNLLIAQYYAYELNDDKEAQRYYSEASRLSRDKILAYPSLDLRQKILDPQEQIQVFSSRSLLEIGRFYKERGKPKPARKAFSSLVKDYGRQKRVYRSAAVRRNTKEALEELVALRAARGEAFSTYESTTGDPQEELRVLVGKVLESMTRNRPKDIRFLIPKQGIESGVEPGQKDEDAETEHYSQAAMLYQLNKKQGPHYEQLFGWLKKNRIKAEDIKFLLSQEQPDLFFVQIVYLGKNRTQKLYFRIINFTWYLVFIGLD